MNQPEDLTGAFQGVGEAMAAAQEAIARQIALAGDLEQALARVRKIPDFPQPGVLFRDLGPVLAHPQSFSAVVYGLAAASPPADVVLGIEARGFMLAASVAYGCGLGVVGARKAGKLPDVGYRASYQLEYGTATLELPSDAIAPGQRVVIIDDVLATGGTANAACSLVEQADGIVAGVVVVLELSQLAGRAQLAGRTVQALQTL